MIVYSLSSYPTRGCGVSRYTEELTEALRRIGVEARSGRVFFLREKFRSTMDLLSAARDIRKTRPEIVHVQYTPTICGPLLPLFLAWVRARARFARIILTAHEKPSVYIRHLSRATGWSFRLYEKSIYSLAHRVLVHTEEHRKELCDSLRVTPGRIEVMPHGVDEAKEVTGEEVNDFRRSYGLGSKPLVTSLGIVRPNKGLDNLLQAMRTVMDDHHELVLLIVGEPPKGQPQHLEELKSTARRLSIDDRVVFTGYVEDDRLPSVLAASLFLVLPYTGATQSGVLHREAITYGKPVVVTDVGGLGELVRRYDIGLVVPPADARVLARAISCLLEDEELRSAFTHKEHDLRTFMGWDSIARSHLALYERTRL